MKALRIPINQYDFFMNPMIGLMKSRSNTYVPDILTYLEASRPQKLNILVFVRRIRIWGRKCSILASRPAKILKTIPIYVFKNHVVLLLFVSYPFIGSVSPLKGLIGLHGLARQTGTLARAVANGLARQTWKRFSSPRVGECSEPCEDRLPTGQLPGRSPTKEMIRNVIRNQIGFLHSKNDLKPDKNLPMTKNVLWNLPKTLPKTSQRFEKICFHALSNFLYKLRCFNWFEGLDGWKSFRIPVGFIPLPLAPVGLHGAELWLRKNIARDIMSFILDWFSLVSP